MKALSTEITNAKVQMSNHFQMPKCQKRFSAQSVICHLDFELHLNFEI
jgi:hypothetical protein